MHQSWKIPPARLGLNNCNFLTKQVRNFKLEIKAFERFLWKLTNFWIFQWFLADIPAFEITFPQAIVTFEQSKLESCD